MADKGDSPSKGTTEAKRPLPVVGDPLGLLSRKPKGAGDLALQEKDLRQLDPAALQSATQESESPASTRERDPRAVARSADVGTRKLAPTAVREVTLSQLRRAILGRPAPHVVLFYGSYCPSCRSLMPGFVNTVREYDGRVAFLALSIDNDRSAFEAYVPALGRVFEPLWLSAPSADIVRETKALGMAWDGDRITVPRLAAFDARGHIVRQGGSKELKRIAEILREL